MPLKVMSLNSKGLNSPIKRAALLREARSLKADIIFAQETHFAANKCPRLNFQHFSHLYLANGLKNACGVFIAIKNSVAFRHICIIPDPQGQYIILICELNQTVFTLVNLYAPNTKQRRFLAPLLAKALEEKQGTLIIGGDFNLILNPAIDSTTSTRRSAHSITPLRHKYELYDIWRCFHGSEKDFTFSSAAHSSYSRIDFFNC